MKIYEKLYKTNRDFKSTVRILVMDKNKDVFETKQIAVSELQKSINGIYINKNLNYYITANSFVPRAKRMTSTVFSLENIVLDFDMHDDMKEREREELIRSFLWHLKRDIFSLIPSPNIIHYTGRGVQLWWTIDSTSIKLKFLYLRAVDYLAELIKQMIDDNPELSPIKIDIGASKNVAGVFRMFETYNTKTRKKSTVELLHTDSIDLNAFVKILESTDYIIERNELKQKRKEARAKRASEKGEGNSKPSGYDNLYIKRMKLAEYAVSSRKNHIGIRHNLLFAYFNTAWSYYGDKDMAAEAALELNKKLNKPIKDFNALTNAKKPYQFKNDTFTRYLGIGDDEYRVFCNEYRRTSVNRTRTSETEKRKINREEAKKQATHLLLTTDKTNREIADETGLSYSAVSKMSAKMKRQAHRQDPWDKLGISRATYYRHKKEKNGAA